MERLGEGRFGVVYKAVDQDTRSPVVLKAIDGHAISSPGFEGSARACVPLKHANVVSIHRFGRDEERALLYFITEFFEARTLRDVVLGEGILGSEKAVSIVLQAAKALAAAHKQNIVHGNIKPQNIMVDGHGVVKVTDFGFCGGQRIGGGTATPYFEYLSPEQIAGHVAFSADIYSLGVTLYYMLSKRHPFEGTTPVQIAFAIQAGMPLSLVEANPLVPSKLWRVVRRMIAAYPKDRYPDMGAVTEDLMANQNEYVPDRVLCPQCSTSNMRGTKSCRACGAILLIECPGCGGLEVSGSSTCGGCGAKFEVLFAVRQNLDRAMRLRSIGDIRRASLLLREVLKLAPGHVKASRESAEVEVALKEIESVKAEVLDMSPDGALARLEELLRKYPGSDDVRILRESIRKANSERPPGPPENPEGPQ